MRLFITAINYSGVRHSHAHYRYVPRRVHDRGARNAHLNQSPNYLQSGPQQLCLPHPSHRHRA